MNPHLRAVIAIWRRELVRVWRQPPRLIATLATPALMWVFLSSGVGSSFSLGSGTYGGHLGAGMVTLTVLFGSIFAAMALIEDRNSGFLQAVLVSPMPRWTMVVGKLGGASSACGMQGLVILPMIWLGEGVPTVGQTLLGVACVLAIAIGASGLSLGAAWKVNSSAGFHGVMNVVIMPMWLLSGALFPISGASGWLAALMTINPLTWTTEALRLCTGPDASIPAWAAVIGTVAFAGLGAIFALATVGRRGSKT